MPEPNAQRLEPTLCAICGHSMRVEPCSSIPAVRRCHYNRGNLKRYHLERHGALCVEFVRILYGGIFYDVLTETDVRRTFIRLVGTSRPPPMPMLLLYKAKRPHE